MAARHASITLANGLAVHARSIDGGTWEPLYGVKDGETVSLPQCLALNEATQLLLDRLSEARDVG